MEGDFERLASHPTYKKHLIDLVSYRIRGKVREVATITKLINKPTKDALSELAEIYPPQPANDPAYISARIRARIGELSAFSELTKGVKCYLDVGCGNGAVTAGIGAHLGLDKAHTHGADIESWAGHSHTKEVTPDITFHAIDAAKDDEWALDMPTGSVDLVTIFMVLHHIRDAQLGAVMRELARVVMRDGIVIIREHDSPNTMIDSLINVEHALFEVVIEKLASPDEFQAHYFGNYKTRRDWVMLMKMYGFEQVGLPIIDTRGTRPVICAFRHTSDVTLDTMTGAELAAASHNMRPNRSRTNTSEQIKRMILHGRRLPTVMTA
jgi:ubiquinone/menaquinone biosynthesis C-methylase UbiE